MRTILAGVAASTLLMSFAVAQTAGTTSGSAAPGAASGSTHQTPAQATTPAGTLRSPTVGAAPGAEAPHAAGTASTSDKAAASGNDNQAVATTSANADTPAKGANSFTKGQAESRIADKGFANVRDLKKDDAGVWRGTADKNGTSTQVWLDYKGNVGTAK